MVRATLTSCPAAPQSPVSDTACAHAWPRYKRSLPTRHCVLLLRPIAMHVQPFKFVAIDIPAGPIMRMDEAPLYVTWLQPAAIAKSSPRTPPPRTEHRQAGQGLHSRYSRSALRALHTLSRPLRLHVDHWAQYLQGQRPRHTCAAPAYLRPARQRHLACEAAPKCTDRTPAHSE